MSQNVIKFVNDIKKDDVNKDKENENNVTFVINSLDDKFFSTSSVNKDGVLHGISVKRDLKNAIDTITKFSNGLLEEFKEVNHTHNTNSSYVFSKEKNQMLSVLEQDGIKCIMNYDYTTKKGQVTVHNKGKITVIPIKDMIVQANEIHEIDSTDDSHKE